MGRATVTIKGELGEALESYRSNQELPPSLAVLMNAAPTEYLSRRGYSSSSEEIGSQPEVYDTLRGCAAGLKIRLPPRWSWGIAAEHPPAQVILYLDASALVKVFVNESGRTEVAEAAWRSSAIVTAIVSYAEARATFARLLGEERLTTRSPCGESWAYAAVE